MWGSTISKKCPQKPLWPIDKAPIFVLSILNKQKKHTRNLKIYAGAEDSTFQKNSSIWTKFCSTTFFQNADNIF